ncbi:hypothetical protein BGZ50_001049 [Haplosporangium sp. Z 11]|nr:hypothetical protein BGZ50_001049 [Haplosporangium sp. Z 11]
MIRRAAYQEVVVIDTASSSTPNSPISLPTNTLYAQKTPHINVVPIHLIRRSRVVLIKDLERIAPGLEVVLTEHGTIIYSRNIFDSSMHPSTNLAQSALSSQPPTMSLNTTTALSSPESSLMTPVSSSPSSPVSSPITFTTQPQFQQPHSPLSPTIPAYIPIQDDTEPCIWYIRTRSPEPKTVTTTDISLTRPLMYPPTLIDQDQRLVANRDTKQTHSPSSASSLTASHTFSRSYSDEKESIVRKGEISIPNSQQQRHQQQRHQQRQRRQRRLVEEEEEEEGEEQEQEQHAECGVTRSIGEYTNQSVPSSWARSRTHSPQPNNAPHHYHQQVQDHFFTLQQQQQQQQQQQHQQRPQQHHYSSIVPSTPPPTSSNQSEAVEAMRNQLVGMARALMLVLDKDIKQEDDKGRIRSLALDTLMTYSTDTDTSTNSNSGTDAAQHGLITPETTPVSTPVMSVSQQQPRDDVSENQSSPEILTLPVAILSSVNKDRHFTTATTAEPLPKIATKSLNPFLTLFGKNLSSSPVQQEPSGTMDPIGAALPETQNKKGAWFKKPRRASKVTLPLLVPPTTPSASGSHRSDSSPCASKSPQPSFGGAGRPLTMAMTGTTATTATMTTDRTKASSRRFSAPFSFQRRISQSKPAATARTSISANPINDVSMSMSSNGETMQSTTQRQQSQNQSQYQYQHRRYSGISSFARQDPVSSTATGSFFDSVSDDDSDTDEEPLPRTQHILGGPPGFDSWQTYQQQQQQQRHRLCQEAQDNLRARQEEVEVRSSRYHDCGSDDDSEDDDDDETDDEEEEDINAGLGPSHGHRRHEYSQRHVDSQTLEGYVHQFDDAPPPSYHSLIRSDNTVTATRTVSIPLLETLLELLHQFEAHLLDQFRTPAFRASASTSLVASCRQSWLARHPQSIAAFAYVLIELEQTGILPSAMCATWTTPSAQVQPCDTTSLQGTTVAASRDIVSEQDWLSMAGNVSTEAHLAKAMLVLEQSCIHGMDPVRWHGRNSETAVNTSLRDQWVCKVLRISTMA